MSKKCARCEKTVYPTEEVKCFDKVWHKLCFKCKDCGMALNMRTYKGFNKEPYCEAHIPKAKATTMAETPELKRIAENTKLQSNVKYHADFEKSKGKFTQVADDPEMLRIRQNTKIISNVAYHGDLLRKAEMEQKRQINENSNGFKDTDVKNANQPQPSSYNPSSSQSHQPAPAPALVQQTPVANPNSMGKITDHDLQAPPGQFQSPYSSRNSQTLIYSSDVGSVNNPPQRHIATGQQTPPSNASLHVAVTNLSLETSNRLSSVPTSLTTGSVHDMDPVNHNYGSLGRVYRAMYDYEAQDLDEVSFQDGDLIINVRSIDGGWMTGEVQRTGQVGMLPANYVQLVNI